MLWSILTHRAGFIGDRAVGARRAEQAKDLAIALLRHQLRLVQRRSPRSPRRSRGEQLTCAVLATKRSRLTTGPRGRRARAILLAQPETARKWHRALVRRTWTYRRRQAGGRPPLAAAVAALLLRLAAEHPRWGDGRRQDELAKPGQPLGRATVREVLQRRRVPPAPPRGRRAGAWRQFLAQQRDVVLACDCFTGETVARKTGY